jgi:ribonuclease BN (tRNA processing enzyme)
MKIIFLGTNGWFDSGTGNTICTLIDAEDFYVILDAGNGLHKADKYIKEKKPVYLFLSHFHIDHIEGLHTLAKFRFKSLDIYGQPGTRRTIKSFLGKKFSLPPERLSYPCGIHDIRLGWNNKPLTFRCLKLKHASRCYGYRFEIEGKIISYCTDTGFCKAAVDLSKDANLLISECSFRSGKENPDWPHLTPLSAARIAVRADAKKLALTHFDAAEYETLAQRSAAQKDARKQFKNSFAAKDGMSIKI